MTRRQAVLAVMLGTVRAMAGDASLFAQSGDSAGRLTLLHPMPPQTVTISLSYFKEWVIHHNGQSVTITADELWQALQPPPMGGEA